MHYALQLRRVLIVVKDARMAILGMWRQEYVGRWQLSRLSQLSEDESGVLILQQQ